MRNCEFCGTEFEPRWERYKSCSPECIKNMQNFRQNNRIRAKRNKELWTLKSYHAFLDGKEDIEPEPPIEGIITNTCTICDKPAGKFDMCRSCERKYSKSLDYEMKGLYHDRKVWG